LWYSTRHTKSGQPRIGGIPGHEFSGVVVQVGSGVSDLHPGAEVYGMNDWFAEGAMAEYCLTTPAAVAAKPKCLSFAEAATVPIGALTAWQGLYDRAKLQAGERVLIHGAAGAVGAFAVQLARQRGARVAATASARDREFLQCLGVDQVIPYEEQRFETVAQGFDVVFDTVGGEMLDRSQKVVKPGGRLLTIAADRENSKGFFLVEANQRQLSAIGCVLDRGMLHVSLAGTVTLEQAPDAFERRTPIHPRGKLVVNLTPSG
jgi:NADPH:quinone reductase-like Zn-dependent oxidoreductase